jgi:hypothetical protein
VSAAEERERLACFSSLLRPRAAARLTRAHASYPLHYDDVLEAIHARLIRHGSADKLDLAALIAWKHVRIAPWMRTLLNMPDAEVVTATRRAFDAGLTDADRIAALKPLPGFGSAGAFTSVILTAWDPARFGVIDRLVGSKRGSAVVDSCMCDWAHLPTYWAHLRAIASELQASSEAVSWTPRAVDMALMNLPS